MLKNLIVLVVLTLIVSTAVGGDFGPIIALIFAPLWAFVAANWEDRYGKR